MANWKLGYPNIDGMATASDGRAVYAAYFSSNQPSIVTTPPKWEAGMITATSATDYSITIGNLKSGKLWAIDDFEYGTVWNMTKAQQQLTAVGYIEHKDGGGLYTSSTGVSNGEMTLYLETESQFNAFSANDYVFFQNGSSAVEFNVNTGLNNPVTISREVEFDVKDTSDRLFGMEAGYQYALGFVPDDILLSFKIHTSSSYDAQVLEARLEAQLRKKLDFKGRDALWQMNNVAPMILEMGSPNRRIMGTIRSFNPQRDATKGDNIIDMEVHIMGNFIPTAPTFEQI